VFNLSKNLFTLTKYTKNVSLLKKPSINVLHQHVLQTISIDRYRIDIGNAPEKNRSPSLENGDTSEKCDQPSPFNYDKITKGNKELEHKLKVLMLETEVLRQDGHQVPSNEYMEYNMWEYLLNLPTRSSRQKYLRYLFTNSKKKEHRMIKQIEKRKQSEEYRKKNPLKGPVHLSIEEHASNYALTCNNIFLRFHETTMNQMYNNRLIQAMQFGQKIVLDCGYDQNMSRRENYNCAKQLMFLFAENRVHDKPFDIHYTNMNKNSELVKMLHKYIPTMYEPEFPLNVHENSYLDLFPKENLVYLTPHCREEMTAYDPNAIYIIGAIVDKINNEPLSLAKAKREGIKMQKFPLDKYLLWGAGSGKCLTLNQCVSILLDVKDGNDWNKAFQHVPRRKLMDSNENQYGEVRRACFREDKSWNPRVYKKPSYIKKLFDK